MCPESPDQQRGDKIDMKFKLVALVSALGLMISVLTTPVKSETNIAIGALFNMSTFDTSGTEREGNVTLSNSTTEEASTTHSEDVEFGSLFLEFTGHLETIPIGVTFGYEYIPGSASLGAKTRTDTQSDAEETSDDSGDYTAKAEISDHSAIYVEPHIGLPNLSLYAKLGLARVTVDTLESITQGESSSAYGDEGIFGTITGVGVKAKHSSGLFLKLEGIQIDYDTITLDSTSGNKNRITATPEQESVRLAIGFAF